MAKSDQVLLALDDPQALQLFERALGAVQYQVAIVRDRPALDQALQGTTPALVIVGEVVAGSAGLEIAANLLERFPTMPVLMFVSKESTAFFKEAFRIGVSGCLFPPLRIEEITKTIENSLARANRIGDWTRREVRRTTASLERRLSELQKMDTIIDNIADGVIILDDQHELLLVNQNARRAFGFWLDEDLTGKPLLEVFPHPDLRALLSRGGESPMPHNEIDFDDGRVLAAQYTPIPGIGVAITMQDITYLRQIDRLKSEFVNTVSHDLRSPLTAILGYVELLERVGPVNDAQRQFISRVQASVQSITALVNDLLELGRIEAGLDDQKDRIPLDELIRYTMENLTLQIEEKQQSLDMDFPPEVPAVLGNPIRLRQMLDNLIGNAIKYTPELGEIRIQVEIQQEQIILRISDSGPGIPPADQPHIFDKFYRASNIPKGVGGSGLGLAIVKSIVDNHQGRIWVESILGQGSTFTVVLPVYQQDGK